MQQHCIFKMNETLNITIPATIGALAFGVGKLIEKARRRGDVDALHYSEASPEEIDEYNRTPYPLFPKMLFHLVPSIMGLIATHLYSGSENFINPSTLTYAATNFVFS